MSATVIWAGAVLSRVEDQVDTTETKRIYHFRGENVIEVVDRGEYRSLYFDNGIVQSKVSLQQPGRLVLRYTQYMMAASLLVQQKPSTILLIGIGAGSLLQFIHRFLPETRVDAVDSSPQIIEIAKSYFSLPQSSMINIYCEDGMGFISSLERKSQYDLILLDAFNDHGMAKTIYSAEFFNQAKHKTAKNGIICCNLWSGNHQIFSRVKKAIQKNSVSNIIIPVRKRENVVALLFQTPTPWTHLSPGSDMVKKLTEKFQLDFREVERAARKNNMKIGEKLQLWFH